MKHLSNFQKIEEPAEGECLVCGNYDRVLYTDRTLGAGFICCSCVLHLLSAETVLKKAAISDPSSVIIFSAKHRL